MSAPVALLSDCLWDVARMERFWNPICKTEVLYDDGVHQEATMAVLRDGRVEQLRIARFRRPAAIDFFNPVPPPSLSWHRGSWSFVPGARAQQTMVVAQRSYELLRASDETSVEYERRCCAFTAQLEVRLEALLNGLRAFVAGESPPPYNEPRVL